MQIHATVMNTKFRKEQTEKGAEGKKEVQDKPERISFDASAILKEYENYAFGDLRVENIQLSDMENINEISRYWKSVATVEFP